MLNLYAYLLAVLALLLLAAAVCDHAADYIRATEPAMQQPGRYDAMRPMGKRWH